MWHAWFKYGRSTQQKYDTQCAEKILINLIYLHITLYTKYQTPKLDGPYFLNLYSKKEFQKSNPYVYLYFYYNSDHPWRVSQWIQTLPSPYRTGSILRSELIIEGTDRVCNCCFSLQCDFALSQWITVGYYI